MTLPVRTLKIEERWDCHGCAACCRGSVIPLDDEELRRLGEQGWEAEPELEGRPVVVRRGLGKGRYQLAKREDGSCVFLLADGRCRIHRDHGPEAKPWTCRMFPFQLVPVGEVAYLTLRRSCPSAAAGRGRKVEEHRRAVVKLARKHGMLPEATAPPAIVRKERRSWKETLRVMEVIERLMLDGRYPMVRRVVHGLGFCDLLAACRLKKLDAGRLAELLGILERGATEGASELFRDRPPPGRTARLMFRQAALDYLRLHPSFLETASLRGRLRLGRAAVAMMRGRGRVPRLFAAMAETTFEAAERPLPELGPEVWRPLVAYFEASAASKQYAVLGRQGWSLVDSFRGLAFSYAMALWTLRLVAGDRPPAAEDMLGVVAAIDRGQGFAALAGRRHRRRVASLARPGELARLIAWYAR